MRLYEEYAKRYELAPVHVRHEKQGALILIANNRIKTSMSVNKWILMTFKWIDNGTHPGRYFVEYQCPIHDGSIKDKYFTKYTGKDLAWDEYEHYWRAWSKEIIEKKSLTPITGQQEIVLSSWEMFVYCFDEWICRQKSELKCYIHNSMDTDLSITDRYIAYQNALIYLTSKSPAILKIWKHEILGASQWYSHWLATLVQSEERKLILS